MTVLICIAFALLKNISKSSKISMYTNNMTVLICTVFASLKNISKSFKISMNTKLSIYKSNVLGILLYGAESWKITTTIANKINVFQTRCIRRILHTFWLRTISNGELYDYKQTNTQPLFLVVKEKRWIGYVLRMQSDSIPRVAMTWTPPVRRERERERRTTAKEHTEQGWIRPGDKTDSSGELW
jgi:hypothetical protein